MTDQPLIASDDLQNLRQISEIALSPDQRWAAFVRMDVDLTANGYTRNLWLADLQNGALHQITRSGKDSQPVWSPSGEQLAFTSARNGKPQIYLLNLTAPGGEPRPLTEQLHGATDPSFSPDGTLICYLAPSSELERRQWDNPEIVIESDEKRFDPRVVKGVPYRVGTSYLSDRYKQLLIAPIAEDPDGEIETDSYVLTNFNGDHQYPRWSADQRYITFSRIDEPDGDEFFRRTRVYRIALENGEITQLTDETHAAVMPTPSPDGRWLAFMRFPNEQMSLKYNRLALMDLESGTVRDVNLDVDACPVTFSWGGDKLYFSAPTRGRSILYQVDPETASAKVFMDDDQRADTFAVGADETLVYAGVNQSTLSELYHRTPDGKTHQLTHLHSGFLQAVKTSRFEEINYTSTDGAPVQGWYLLPPDYEQGKQYPLIVNIHGGPHLMWSANDENMWHEFQYMAAQGYAVFFCNPRGSMGYGEAHQVAIAGQWGDLAMQDIMAGVETISAKGFVDTARLFITGGSYGGYMTTWMIGHSDRFKAAVTQRGVYNLLSFFGTTDIPSFVDNEFGFTPLNNPQLMWEHSPLAYAHNINTPTLIIHSENDFRVAISEGEQLFGYLRYKGVPTEFVRYPREGHELSRSGEPEHRIDRLQRIITWFDRYKIS